MAKIHSFILLVFLLVPPLFAGAHYPTGEEKMKVRVIVTRVAQCSRKAPTLDALCQATMRQSAEMLNIGPCAVYELSCLLDHPDWKVRFWIVDMLGYLENPDGVRPLQRVIGDERELDIIRERARLSLRRVTRQKKETASDGLAVKKQK